MGDGLARNGSGPPLKLFQEHPSWFWPNNESTSIEGQLCWGEPTLVAFLTERVRAIMLSQPNTTLLSISVLDNHRFCQTSHELAIIAEEHNSPIGPLIRALNTIGAAVEQEFPKLTLTTLACERRRHFCYRALVTMCHVCELLPPRCLVAHMLFIYFTILCCRPSVHPSAQDSATAQRGCTSVFRVLRLWPHAGRPHK